MANTPGPQSDKTMNREVKPNAGCDIPGRQYAQHDEYSGGYQDVEFEQFNQLLPQDPEYFHREATAGQGQFRGPNSVSDESLAKQIASMEIRPHENDFTDSRSTHFVDVMNANRGAEHGFDENPNEYAPVKWPGDRPQSTGPDFGEQLRRNDVEGRPFRKPR